MRTKFLRFEGFAEVLASIEADRQQNDRYHHDLSLKKRETLIKMIKAVADRELTPRQRTAFYMYYFDKMTMEQIAGSLGVCRSTVSRAISGADKKIATYLKYFFAFFYNLEA